jgi:uncharacterized Fe-S cluster protein YjdI
MIMKKTIKAYTKDDLIVRWNPDKCMHSAICFHGLPSVFDPRKRPWIDLEGGLREDIINQVRKCPSGALSLQMDEKV